MKNGERLKSAIDVRMGKIDQESVSLEVSRRLLTLVVSGDIRPGDRLPSERELSAQLGVGRNAIRDGLRPLVLLGVLEVRPGSGTYVKDATSDLLPDILDWGLLLRERRLHELIEARLFIETALSRLAAEKRAPKDLRSLQASLSKMATAESPEKFAEADQEFHRRIANAADNDVLAGMLRNIRTLLSVWIRPLVTVQDMPGLYAQHEAVCRAIEAGNGQVAAAAMEEHLSVLTERLNDRLEAEQAHRQP